MVGGACQMCSAGVAAALQALRLCARQHITWLVAEKPPPHRGEQGGCSAAELPSGSTHPEGLALSRD